MESAIGAVLWANVATGALIQLFNAAVLEHTSTKKRMGVVCLLFVAGLVAIAMSPHVNFYFMLFAVLLVGTGTSFGQCVMVGELKRYAPTMVGGWSSGTGLAGIAGSFTMILLSYLDVSIELTFFLILPLIVVYGVVYFFMLKPPTADSSDPDFAPPPSVAGKAGVVVAGEGPADTERSRLLSPVSPRAGIQASDLENPGGEGGVAVAPEGESGCGRAGRLFRLILWKGMNMGLVYFFEYWISVGCAADAEPKTLARNASFWQAKSFVVLAACYQLGVFVSRSSLRLFKVSHIEIFTILQGINLGFWLADDIYKWMPYYIQFVAMFYVGLLGGCSYVNTLYVQLNDPRTPETDRKMALYGLLIFINVGIALAAGACLISDATFLKDDVPTGNS